MSYINRVSETHLTNLSNVIKSNILKKDFFRGPRVFLCGGSVTDNKSVRHALQELFSSKNNEFFTKYDISYPEDIFDELLSSGRDDLLSLESLLAESVDTIIIVVESQGSIAELGAFINDENLINKIIVVNDVKYKNSKSFINQGPLKLLRKNNTKSVLYVDFESVDCWFNDLLKTVNSFYKKNKDETQDLTLLNLDSFIIPLLYVTNTLNKEALYKMVSSLVTNKKYNNQIISSALNSIVKKRLIEKNNDNYKLSPLGIKYFKEKFYTFQGSIIDKIRIDLLNLAYRGRGGNKKFRQIET